MDKKTVTENRVLKKSTAALQVPGIRVQLETGSASVRRHLPKALVSVKYGNQRIDYHAVVKRNLRPATIGPVIQQLRALNARPLLVADYVTPPLAARLQELGVEFIDTAGNAWLKEPPLCVWITGRRPPEAVESEHQPAGRAFQASGLRVLFALLCKPDIVDRPYREIARLAGVAHGTVGWVMADMPKLGYLATYRKTRILVKLGQLLGEWSAAYAHTLRPKLLIDRYRADDIEWWKTQDPTEFGFNLGGEAAGARMTGYLMPAKITLYGDELDAKLLARFRLRKDPRGNVEFMKRFWVFDEKEPLTPAPLVYADLLATGDTRCIETAELIHKKIVDGFQNEE